MQAPPIADAELERIFAGLTEFSSIALAVSGGADSMALMHLVARWREALSGIEAHGLPDVVVLTVDHGLRAGSADDCRFVASEAGDLGLSVDILEWRDGRPESAVQARARSARYDLMSRAAARHGCSALVTAHTLDDQAETFLMRLARGSGVDGLSGVPERGNWRGLPVLRPMLGVSHDRLVATLRSLGVEWREDPSNQDTGFERIRIRQALPGLDDIGIERSSIAQSAHRLARARKALEQSTTELLRQIVNVDDFGVCRVSRPGLAAAAEELALRAMARVFQFAGGGQPVRLAKLEAIMAALHGEAPPAMTFAGALLRVMPRHLSVRREPLRSPLPESALAPGRTVLWDNRFRIAATQDATEGVTIAAIGSQGFDQLRSNGWRPDGSAAREVILTLPGLWLGGRLAGVPELQVDSTERGSTPPNAVDVRSRTGKAQSSGAERVAIGDPSDGDPKWATLAGRFQAKVARERLLAEADVESG